MSNTPPSVLQGAWRGTTRAPGYPRAPRGPPSAARESPGATALDLGDHRLCLRARDRAASQGHIVVDLDHHAATTEQQHRAQLRVAIDANDNFYTFSYHLLHRHAGDPSLWSIGLGTGQDLGVGRSHLCGIAEVQPNDAGLCLVRNIRRIDLESHRKGELLCGRDGDPAVSPPRVRIADVGRKKFEEAKGRAITARHDRRRPWGGIASDGNQLVDPCQAIVSSGCGASPPLRLIRR
jgi:hypothetical protein